MPCHPLQGGGHAAARSARHQQVPVGGSPAQVWPGPVVGIVDHADGVGGHCLGGEHRRKRIAPQWRRGGDAGLAGRFEDRGNRSSRIEHACGLEHQQFVRPEAHRAPAGKAAVERCRGLVADHVDRIGPVVETQREAEVGVGADLVADDACRTLGGQHEMHPEAPAALRDADQRVQHLGMIGGERGELVDQHHQAGQDGRVGQIDDVGDAALAQHRLTLGQLGTEAAQHPVDRSGFEVGHQTGHVRQIDEHVERRTALEVDEDHTEPIRWQCDGEAEHQRAEQFALAGAGGAGEQRVRPVSYEIHIHHTIAGPTERGARRRRCAPARCDRRRIGDIDADIALQRFPSDRRRHRTDATVDLRVDPRGQSTCDGRSSAFTRPGDAHLDRRERRRRVAEQPSAAVGRGDHHGRAPRRGDGGRVVVDHQHRPVLVGGEAAANGARAHREGGGAVDDEDRVDGVAPGAFVGFGGEVEQITIVEPLGGTDLQRVRQDGGPPPVSSMSARTRARAAGSGEVARHHQPPIGGA